MYIIFDLKIFLIEHFLFHNFFICKKFSFTKCFFGAKYWINAPCFSKRKIIRKVGPRGAQHARGRSTSVRWRPHVSLRSQRYARPTASTRQGASHGRRCRRAGTHVASCTTDTSANMMQSWHCFRCLFCLTLVRSLEVSESEQASASGLTRRRRQAKRNQKLRVPPDGRD